MKVLPTIFATQEEQWEMAMNLSCSWARSTDPSTCICVPLTAISHRASSQLQSRFYKMRVNGSIQLFVDDVLRIILLDCGKDAAAMSETDRGALDIAINEDQYEQNEKNG